MSSDPTPTPTSTAENTSVTDTTQSMVDQSPAIIPTATSDSNTTSSSSSSSSSSTSSSSSSSAPSAVTGTKRFREVTVKKYMVRVILNDNKLKYSTPNQIESELQRNQIGFKDIWKKKGMDNCMIYFNTEDELNKALEVLPTIKSVKDANKCLFKFRGPPQIFDKNITVDEDGKEVLDHNKKRRKTNNNNSNNKEGDNENSEADDNNDNDKSDGNGSDGELSQLKNKTTSSSSEPRSVNDVVAPLWKLPYEQQLKIKHREVVKLLTKTTRKYRQEFPNIKFKYERDNMFVPLEDIVPSPNTEGYRNKCEFSIGVDEHGLATVGFLMGKYTEGITTIGSVESCPHIPEVSKVICTAFTEFLRKSPLKTYGKINHEGFWRLLSIRNAAETGELLIMVQVNPRNLTPEAIEGVKDQVRHFFVTLMDEEWTAKHKYKLVCLLFQQYEGVSNAAPDDCPLEKIYGTTEYVNEKIFGLTFRVSQNAFFQVNIPGVHKLYGIAADWAQCTNKTTLLDVCCGTGTIGLTMANKVHKVVGLEMVASAIDDAKENANINGIKNAHYIVGKAEDTINSALRNHAISNDIVAIVDPPRAGLHPDVLRLLRSCSKIHRVVYISCNPKTLADNLIRLVQPVSKRWVGEPFHAVKAIPVDMFPHTEHCEMVVLLEREPHRSKYYMKAAAAGAAAAAAIAASRVLSSSDADADASGAVADDNVDTENVEVEDASKANEQDTNTSSSSSTSEPAPSS